LNKPLTYVVFIVLSSSEQWVNVAPEIARFAASLHYCPATGIGRRSIGNFTTSVKGLMPSLFEFLIERRDRSIAAIAFVKDLKTAETIVECVNSVVGNLSLPGNGVACIFAGEKL
jgi:hypothetical protein